MLIIVNGGMWNNMDNKCLKIIKNWFDNKADNWQKDAFNNLWKGLDISKVKDRALRLAMKEYDLYECTLVANTTFPNDLKENDKDSIPTSLVSIAEVKGVCALQPIEALKFGPGLNIVFGENGCGKSSYVKILKKAEDPKSDVSIFGNIFKENNMKPSAKLVFSTDDGEDTVSWSLSNTKSYPIKIYDTQIARQFVEDKTEVIYEPEILSLFSYLTDVTEYVSNEIKNKCFELESSLIKPPTDVESVDIIKSYLQINTVTDIESFLLKFSFDEELQSEYIQLEDALKDSDPNGTKKRLSAQKNVLSNIQKEIIGYTVSLDDSEVSSFIKCYDSLISSKKAYDNYISEAKKISLLKGFGSNEWNSLWRSSKAYAEYLRQIETDSDNSNSQVDLCVLCQQSLTPDALNRMQLFENFSKSNAKKEYEDFKNNYNERIEKILELKKKLNKSSYEQILDSNAIEEETKNKIIGFITSLFQRVNWLFEYNKGDNNIPAINSVSEVNNFFADKINSIDEHIEALVNVIDDYDCQAKRLTYLKALKWIFDNKHNFDVKKKIINHENLIQNCKTNSLTTTKKSLSQILITDAYIDKFTHELNEINPQNTIKVQLVQSASKGKIYHKVSLVEAKEKRKTADILSEGEYRAVSIAAFLTDLSSWNSNQAFIFDDPINSLDQNYEERIANRLVLLAQERQVIVFTHRLAFAEMLNRISKSFNKKEKHNQSLKHVDISYIKLMRNPLGNPNYQDDFSNPKLDAKLNGLCEPISKARKSLMEGDNLTYEFMVKGICSKLRDIIEKSIETTLLNNVVSRYSRIVQTMRIRYLKGIRESDVDFIDSMMTKYSVFDHSDSTEAPVSLPTLEDIESDISAIKSWYSDFATNCKRYE